MKKTTVFSATIFGLGSAIAILGRVAGYASFNCVGILTAIADLFVCMLLLMAISDYSHKRRFRVRRDRKAMLPATTPATSSEVEPVTVWTYATYSA